jgi:hypothetical protein
VKVSELLAILKDAPQDAVVYVSYQDANYNGYRAEEISASYGREGLQIAITEAVELV